MSMERTPSARTGRRSDNLSIFFLHFISTQSTCQRVSTLSLSVGHYCPTNAPDNRGRHLLQIPQQGSFFSYISPGSSLGKSMTCKLVYNFPLMSTYFISSLLRVPNSNDNYTVTLNLLELRYRSVVLPQRYGEVELQKSEDNGVHRLRGLVPNSDEKQTRE